MKAPRTLHFCNRDARKVLPGCQALFSNLSQCEYLIPRLKGANLATSPLLFKAPSMPLNSSGWAGAIDKASEFGGRGTLSTNSKLYHELERRRKQLIDVRKK